MFRVFITNLGKYNEGKLVGKWLDLPCDDIEEELKTIGVSDKPDENGIYYEEYFITDYENDIDMEIGEYDNLYKLNEYAKEIEELNDDEKLCLKALIEYGEDLEFALEHIGDVATYGDCWSMTEVAYLVVEELDILNEIPEEWQNYFDYEAFGRDLDIEGKFIYMGNGIYAEIMY